MGRIQDYQHFAASKATDQPRGQYSFIHRLGETDIYLENLPDEVKDLSDVEATIEYSIEPHATKSGIESIAFRVDMIELVLSVDKYPNGKDEIDLDIARIPLSAIKGDVRPFTLLNLDWLLDSEEAPKDR